MNEYNINVDFTKGRILTNLKRLVQNDYNTTKLNFTFDKEGKVLFKMLYPDGTQYVDEIQNNELIFDKGVLNQEGTYEYEISLYTGDGRLTDYTVKSFEVRNELVDTDELVEADDRVPVLDTLINEIETIKQDVEEGKYNGKDGVDGKDGLTPTIGENGNWFIGDVDTGMPSRGETGEVDMTNYPTIEEMNNAINEAMDSGSGIPVLTDEKIILGDLDFGYYILEGVKTIQYQNSNASGYNLGGSSGVKYKDLLLVFGENQYYKYAYHIRGTSIIFLNVYDKSYKQYYFSNFAKKSDVLIKTNTTSYTPTSDYHPATKKYVDDLVGESGGSGITELTDYELVLSNLEVGVYILNGVYRIRYGSKTDVITTTLYKPILIVSQTINNGTGVNIGYLFNANNISIYDSKQGTKKSIYGDFLSKTNTTEYTPTSDYNPATKKYVDDLVGNISTVLATLTEVSE